MEYTEKLIYFEMLCEEHGYEKNTNVSHDLFDKYKNQLPKLMLDIWGDYGLTSHGSGEIWFTNPDDFKDITKAYFGDKDDFVVYARHSFGYLYAIMKDKLYIIYPQQSRAKYMGSIDNFGISISSIINDSPRHKNHLAALRRFGPIKSSQMYGYVPVLALGGDGSLAETQIVQMHEYLLMTAEIATEAVRNGWNPLGLPDS